MHLIYYCWTSMAIILTLDPKGPSNSRSSSSNSRSFSAKLKGQVLRGLWPGGIYIYIYFIPIYIYWHICLACKVCQPRDKPPVGEFRFPLLHRSDHAGGAKVGCRRASRRLGVTLQDGAPKIAFSCLVSDWIPWFMVDITIVYGGYYNCL